jgi:hypothetical protein
MRGVKDQGHRPAASASTASSGHDAELAAALREVARELRETRAALTARTSGGKDSGHV